MNYLRNEHPLKPLQQRCSFCRTQTDQASLVSPSHFRHIARIRGRLQWGFIFACHTRQLMEYALYEQLLHYMEGRRNNIVILTPVLTRDSIILSFKANVSPCFILILFLSKHFIAYLKKEKKKTTFRKKHQKSPLAGLFTGSQAMHIHRIL